MFLAFSVAMRFADLSRQVGAVIVSSNREVLAMGYNDPPRFSGGLYFEGAEPECRDFKLGMDSNSTERQRILEEVLSHVKSVKTLSDSESEELLKLLKSNSLSSITEYGRAAHAEMEVVLSCVRRSISCQGASLYATTFPCHNCARHIIAAGIKKVVYVEPYPKSKALTLHSDALSNEPDDKKVEFSPFEGVGPRRFLDFFSMTMGDVSID